MAVIAHYLSHGHQDRREFDTARAAVSWLSQEDEFGNLAPLRVEDGERVIEGDELCRLLWDEPVVPRSSAGIDDFW